MSLHLELLTTDSQFLALEPEWNDLLKDSPANNIFLTWEWVSTWWQWFGEEYHLWIVTVRQEEDGRLLGIAPLIWRRYLQLRHLPLRELLFIGSNKTAPDHLDFIVHKSSQGLVDDALTQFVWAHRKQWDFIHFDSMKSTSLALANMCHWGSPRWQKIDDLVCPVIKLPDSGDAFDLRLGKTFRRNLRRRIRQLTEKKLLYTKVLDKNELDDAFADLRCLHQAVRQDKGDAGAFIDSRMESFQQQVATRFLQKNYLRFYTLQVDDQIIVADYNFFYNNVFYSYMTGYDQAWSRYSPGGQMTSYAIHQAIEEGATKFDFLRGDEAYKFKWNAQGHETKMIQIAISFRAKILTRMREMKAAMRSRKLSEDEV